MDLLLQADPSETHINTYLPESEVFLARDGNQLLGVFVIAPISDEEMEVKNLSVKQEYQSRGIGKEMLKYAVRIAKMEGFQYLIIKTADSSVHQRAFYEKMKFEYYFTVKAHFLKYYDEPIIENGKQAVDQLAFRRKL